MVIPRKTEVHITPRSTQSQSSAKQSTTQPSMKSSLATASAIARDPKHPKREQAEELVRAYQRGWIDSLKFNEILQQLIF